MISVVIPVRDDEAALRQLLGELQSFRSAEFEVIVVEADDAAIDSPMVDQVDLWQRGPAGRARQLQQGADAASGQCLWFLHADSSGISAAAHWLIQHSRYATASHGDVGWGRFDVRFDDSAWAMSMVAWFMNWRSKLTAICTGDQGLFVDRLLLLDAGGWPQQLLMEDVELCSRLRRQRKPHVPSGTSLCLTTSARRWRTNGTWRTILLMWRLRLGYALGKDPAELHALYYPGSTAFSHVSSQDTQRDAR